MTRTRIRARIHRLYGVLNLTHRAIDLELSVSPLDAEEVEVSRVPERDSLGKPLQDPGVLLGEVVGACVAETDGAAFERAPKRGTNQAFLRPWAELPDLFPEWGRAFSPPLRSSK